MCHFVTEMCKCVHVSVIRALWNICPMHCWICEMDLSITTPSRNTRGTKSITKCLVFLSACRPLIKAICLMKIIAGIRYRVMMVIKVTFYHYIACNPVITVVSSWPTLDSGNQIVISSGWALCILYIVWRIKWTFSWWLFPFKAFLSGK